ncbi:MAG TPA: YciI family protein [Salinimicrobium sp.]|nr:YciI family protein [Salinimicrobium sp.]
MKKFVFAISVLTFAMYSCEEKVKETPRSIPSPEKVELLKPDLEKQAEDLKEKGYQAFLYKEGDSTYLMQQYYMVFLKSGENRSQDSLETAKLMEGHLAHLNRMATEGYASLIGPMGDDGELRGIVVYQTPTQQEADSLANMDPMVKAGRLKVEIHPWWTEKGGKLK